MFVEPTSEDAGVAVAESEHVEGILAAAGVRLEQVHHGTGAAAWAVLDSAARRGHGVRIGLEDTGALPDGRRAAGNAELVGAASRALERLSRPGRSA